MSRGPLTEAPTPTLGGAREPVSDAPSVGTQIDRYTVLEQLGAGGMGEVYAAFDNKLDRKVALKLLRHRSDEYEARLMREAQAMARLLHPNVVAVFDTGVTGNRLYLAMEFVRGKTLRGWQKAETRSLEEVLRVYRQAGEGLAAAHAVGLVHRDFKPDNVLIADDGRVKVTDFGIARATGEQPLPAAQDLARRLSSRPPPLSGDTGNTGPSSSATTLPTSGSLGNPLTEEGTLLGTPGYMAPEQFLCDAVDERTDQFAFCVSLYEALYGVRPFAGSLGRPTLEQIAQATLEGKIDEPPKGAIVPEHVRRVMLRGLAAEPAARFPSMRELLEDLARDPSKQRRRRLGAAVLAVVTAATAAAVAIGAARHRASLAAACAAEAGAIYTHWAAPQREVLEKAMVSDQGALALERTTRTLTGLDTFAEAWKTEAQASCTATRLAKTQPDDVYEKRSACLLGARQGFDALVDVLTERDARVHQRAAAMLGRLAPPRLCTGREGDHSYTPLPPEPARRVLVEEARRLTTRARILSLSGRYREAVALADQAAAKAREAAAPADEAKALLTAASTLSKTYDRELSVTRGHEAMRAAERAGDDHTAATAAADLAFDLSSRVGRLDEADAWLAFGWSKLARIGKDDYLESRLLVAQSQLAHDRGKDADAVITNGQQIELTRSLFGPHSPDLCAAFNNRAVFLANALDNEGALQAARDAIVCHKEDGEKPAAGSSYNMEAWELYALGRYAEAVEAYRLGIEARQEYPSDPVTMEALCGTALSEIARGRFDQGEAYARRVLRAYEDGGTDLRSLPPASREDHATALFALGEARAGLGDVPGARRACADSLAEFDEIKSIAEDLPYGLDALRCLGEAELATGDVQEARKHLERSLRMTKRLFPGHMARAKFAFARALAAPPKADAPRARALAVEAQGELQNDVKKNPTLATLLADVERWLAGQRP